jgi:hypothetical protein
VSEQTTLGYVYGVAGKMEQAREILAELRKRSVSQFYLSFVYIGLGEKDEALLCLERTYRERSFMLSNVATQAMFDPLRSDPRFQDLQRRITNMMLNMDSHQEISKY